MAEMFSWNATKPIWKNNFVKYANWIIITKKVLREKNERNEEKWIRERKTLGKKTI